MNKLGCQSVDAYRGWPAVIGKVLGLDLSGLPTYQEL
jgi:hypothetical protein